MLATMTALKKKDGGVRGIATGTAFRRLVAKTLARQFGKAVEEACSPFQFALSTRAGVDCVGHAVRAVTDADHLSTVLSVDGVGAYDHVFRASMLSKLLEVPKLQPLLPFVRKAYGAPSCYRWDDADGQQHQIWQHEGGEQGDPLMPLLFSLAMHNALLEVKSQLQDGEFLFAFLDDVYVISSPARTKPIYEVLRDRLQVSAGIQLHQGKTRVWNRAGVRPLGIEEWGEDVWSPHGLKILGTPVGTQEFVRAIGEERLQEERKLWEALSWVSDLQAAWQILVQCAGPRCHHFLRTLPPGESREYAEGHDEGMMDAMRSLLGGLPGTEVQKYEATQIATLPMRLGGLGIRSARRMGHAAFWALWADAMRMIWNRLPAVVLQVLGHLADDRITGGCLGELKEAAQRLDREGFVNRPTWLALRDGARPPPVDVPELGEWQHGWQFYASSSSEHHFRKSVVLAQSSATDQAHLRSHSGPGSGAVLLGCPTSPEFRLEPEAFRIIALERLRASTPRYGGSVRMWRCAGHERAPPSSLPKFWSTAEQSHAHRKNSRARMPRSRSHGSHKRQVEGHERGCCSRRREVHRGGGVRVAPSPRRPTRHRHHAPMCHFGRWPPPSELCTRERRSPDPRKDEQGDKIRRARRQQPLPPGGGGAGDRRPLEHRSHGVC